mmetsp:Transcript_78313/g.181707  ORF Transcript_78313/g.181707 Transcript_78313/m.181707 type:complete len:252 (+) Transcript_78313:241-996(+)
MRSRASNVKDVVVIAAQQFEPEGPVLDAVRVIPSSCCAPSIGFHDFRTDHPYWVDHLAVTLHCEICLFWVVRVPQRVQRHQVLALAAFPIKVVLQGLGVRSDAPLAPGVPLGSQRADALHHAPSSPLVFVHGLGVADQRDEAAHERGVGGQRCDAPLRELLRELRDGEDVHPQEHVASVAAVGQHLRRDLLHPPQLGVAPLWFAIGVAPVYPSLADEVHVGPARPVGSLGDNPQGPVTQGLFMRGQSVIAG